MPPGQIEDDTAEINPYQKKLLINTDLLVDGIHFSPKTMRAEDVGWRAIAANISDLAASGVDKIIGVTVGLVAPPSTTWDWVEKVYIGINEALDKYGGYVMGGDCSHGTQKLLAITAIGSLGPLRIHRSNALPGDLIVVSGAHGLSRLGLALLLQEPQIKNLQLTKQLKEQAKLVHQRPHPPLQALRTLENCKPKNLPWRAGGTDSSDGLIEAINSLCKNSACRAVLDPKKLPKHIDWPIGAAWEQWCLNGGEDFELVLSLPASWANAWTKVFPTSRIIGKITNGEPKITWSNGQELLENSSCFQHFKFKND